MQDLLALATNIFNYKLSETNGFPYEKTAHRYDKVGDVVIPCDLSSDVTALRRVPLYRYGLHAFRYSEKQQ